MEANGCPVNQKRRTCRVRVFTCLFGHLDVFGNKAAKVSLSQQIFFQSGWFCCLFVVFLVLFFCVCDFALVSVGCVGVCVGGWRKIFSLISLAAPHQLVANLCCCFFLLLSFFFPPFTTTTKVSENRNQQR